MYVNYKYRLYPDACQQAKMQRTFGCVRYVYNHFLQLRRDAYDTSGRTPSSYEQSRELPALMQEHPWLKEVDASALYQALRALDSAYRDVFRLRSQGKPFHHPRFKAKKQVGRQSYKSTGDITIEGRYIRLPTLGPVKARISRPMQGRILSAAVSRTPSGRYYVTLTCTDVQPAPLPKTGRAVGLDMGVHTLVTTSDGESYPNPRYFAKQTRRFSRLQRRLQRKPSGSKRWKKNLLQIVRLEEHISNQRKDNLNKLSIDLLRRYDVCAVEDLSMEEMRHLRDMNAAVQDASIGMFLRMLVYKARWYGKTVVKVDRYFPSSQLCSACGAQWPGTRDLSVREWACPTCGQHHDRDVNAAVNIRREGLRLLSQ